MRANRRSNHGDALTTSETASEQGGRKAVAPRAAPRQASNDLAPLIKGPGAPRTSSGPGIRGAALRMASPVRPPAPALALPESGRQALPIIHANEVASVEKVESITEVLPASGKVAIAVGLDGHRAPPDLMTGAEMLQEIFRQGHSATISAAPENALPELHAGIVRNNQVFALCTWLQAVFDDIEQGLRHDRPAERRMLLRWKTPEPAASPRRNRIYRVWRFIVEHLDESLPNERLAEVAGVTRSQLYRDFFAETGRTPANAVEELRVIVARPQVEAGLDSLETIARRVGFTGAWHMRDAFVRVTGKAPLTLRKEAQT